MTRRTARFLAAATAVLLMLPLAGCGESPVTRAVTGGALGAGVGAGAAAITGGRPATGAVIGAGVGALGGALTSP